MSEPANEIRTLQGRAALVTGASSGLGRATAISLTRAGADIAIVARSKEELGSVREEVTEIGRRALALPIDLASANETAEAATQVQQKRPGLLSRILGGGTARRSTGEETPADSTPPATPQVGAPQVGTGGMLGNPMAKGILGGIAAAGLMNMLTGPHYYSGGLFGPPVMGGFFGGGPVFGGYGFGEGYEEGYEEGLEEGFEGDFGGGDF
jgi:hypothetical protein